MYILKNMMLNCPMLRFLCPIQLLGIYTILCNCCMVSLLSPQLLRVTPPGVVPSAGVRPRQPRSMARRSWWPRSRHPPARTCSGSPCQSRSRSLRRCLHQSSSFLARVLKPMQLCLQSVYTFQRKKGNSLGFILFLSETCFWWLASEISFRPCYLDLFSMPS